MEEQTTQESLVFRDSLEGKWYMWTINKDCVLCSGTGYALNRTGDGEKSCPSCVEVIF